MHSFRNSDANLLQGFVVLVFFQVISEFLDGSNVLQRSWNKRIQFRESFWIVIPTCRIRQIKLCLAKWLEADSMQ